MNESGGTGSPMRVLALDTSTRRRSVALVDEHRIVEERCGDASRTHTEQLPREILDLLADHGLATSDVDLFAVVSGPGSFTGLRTGIATLQGFAFVHRRPMAAISALDALGHLGSRGLPDGSLVGVWMDAMRRDVFSALYRVGPSPMFDPERLVTLDPPQVGPPLHTLERWQRLHEVTAAVFIGDGATAFADELRVRCPRSTILPHATLAGAAGCIGAMQASRGLTTDPGAMKPLYVRRPDAEVERERRSAGR